MKNKIVMMLMASILVVACSTPETNKEQSIEEKKAEVYYNQGTSDLINQNYQNALISLLKAKELNSKDSKVRNNLGMAYYFRNQNELAVAELKEAINLDKKNTDAKLNLATVYLNQNNLKEAKRLLNECVSDLTFTSLFRAHYNLALLNLKIGDRKSAFEELFLSLKENPEYCSAHFKLGELYTEEYKYNEAYKSFIESTKGTCVNNPEPHYFVAETLINLNRIEDAKLKLKELSEKFPKSNFKILALKKLKNLNQNSQEANENINPSKLTETPKF